MADDIGDLKKLQQLRTEAARVLQCITTARDQPLPHPNDFDALPALERHEAYRRLYENRRDILAFLDRSAEFERAIVRRAPPPERLDHFERTLFGETRAATASATTHSHDPALQRRPDIPLMDVTEFVRDSKPQTTRRKAKRRKRAREP